MRSKEGRRSTTFTERARRAQIVARSVEVVAEIGYGQASIRKIAERVGVAMSVVLYHFANKEELVRAIVADAYRSAIATVEPAVTAEATARGKLRAYIRANAEFMASHRTQHLAILEIGLNYRSANGERLDQLDVDADLRDELAVLDLEPILRMGRDHGEFRDLDPGRVAMAVRGALNGATLRLADDPGFDVRGYGEELVTVFDLATRRV